MGVLVRVAVFFGILGTLWGLPSVSTSLEMPSGPTVLIAAGKIGNTNQGDKAILDMAALRALPQKTLTTDTVWDKRPVKFSGPLLRDVLRLLKASGTEIRAIAVNDYAVTIPVSDTHTFDVIIATRLNDRDIPPRTKGPLFIVYPFNSDPVLKDKRYEERAIWQLKAIEVK